MNYSDISSVPLPQAILWDLDGTIIDSEEYWIVAEKELVELFGGTWTHQDGLDLVGNGLEQTAQTLKNKGVNLSIDEIVQTLTSRVLEQLEVAIPWRPGAIELIQECAQAQIPQALVTMSINRMATTVANAIEGAPFTVVVAGDQVSQPKPSPEPYLQAAEKLDVSLAKSVVFEDSPAGCTSALAAGALTLGVENLVSLDNIPTHQTLSTLAGFGLDELLQFYREQLEAAV